VPVLQDWANSLFSKEMDVVDSADEEKKEESTAEATIDFAISSVNHHIAFIVSDVGNSAYFYTDVLGMQ
jgi:hypothetical protein